LTQWFKCNKKDHGSAGVSGFDPQFEMLNPEFSIDSVRSL